MSFTTHTVTDTNVYSYAMRDIRPIASTNVVANLQAQIDANKTAITKKLDISAKATQAETAAMSNNTKYVTPNALTTFATNLKPSIVPQTTGSSSRIVPTFYTYPRTAKMKKRIATSTYPAYLPQLQGETNAPKSYYHEKSNSIFLYDPAGLYVITQPDQYVDIPIVPGVKSSAIRLANDTYPRNVGWIQSGYNNEAIPVSLPNNNYSYRGLYDPTKNTYAMPQGTSNDAIYQTKDYWVRIVTSNDTTVNIYKLARTSSGTPTNLALTLTRYYNTGFVVGGVQDNTIFVFYTNSSNTKLTAAINIASNSVTNITGVSLQSNALPIGQTDRYIFILKDLQGSSTSYITSYYRFDMTTHTMASGSLSYTPLFSAGASVEPLFVYNNLAYFAVYTSSNVTLFGIPLTGTAAAYGTAVLNGPIGYTPPTWFGLSSYTLPTVSTDVVFVPGGVLTLRNGATPASFYPLVGERPFGFGGGYYSASSTTLWKDLDYYPSTAYILSPSTSNNPYSMFSGWSSSYFSLHCTAMVCSMKEYKSVIMI